MSEKILLVGVWHKPKYLEEVIKAISPVNGRKVMLEIHKYPFIEEFLDKESCTFYNKLAEYTIENGGEVICGENEELLRRVSICFEQFEKLVKMAQLPLSDHDRLYHQLREIVPHIERDPHFLKVLKEQKPDIVVLGAPHIPVLRNFGFSSSEEYDEIYIPADALAYECFL